VTSSIYYEERLPAQMGELAAVLDAEEKFDAIIVDEAQDFGAAWWPPTMACLRDQETGGLYAFLDEAQRVFERYGEVPIPLPPIVLDENIRNTKQIAQVFGSLGAGRRGTAARTARRSGSCNAHQTRQSTRLTPRSTGSSAKAGSRDRLPCW
jgi:hypothetical protein